MSALEKYLSYKDSGVEWIGEIPEHWEVIKIKHLLYEKRKTHNINLNCGSISFGKVVYKDDEKIPHSTKKAYQVVEKGNFLVNPLNLNYDLKSLRIGLSELNVVVSSGYIVLDTLKDINKTYLNWLLHRFDVAFMKTLGAGVRQTLNYTDISTCELVEPPKEEQIKIANFLDSKTTQIDEAIKQKEELIRLLKERRQVLIHKAVTQGLDSTVKMKDSGVEWLGEIPTHWDIKALKYLLKERNDRSETGVETLFMMSQIHGLVVRADYHDKAVVAQSSVGNKKVHKNDLVFNKLKAHLGVFSKSNIDDIGIVSPDYAVYFSIGEITDVKYLELLFKNPIYISHFIRKATGIVEGLIRLYTDDLFNLKVPVPPESEQKEILEYVDTISIKMDTAISIQKKQIKKLKEYKATLIDSSVTGKVKVV